MNKTSIQQVQLLLREMEIAQSEHPKAKIYYDWEDKEIRITYPIPNDMYSLEKITITNIDK